MWRNFIISFERTLALTPRQLTASNCKWKSQITKISYNHRYLSTASILRNTEPVREINGAVEGEGVEVDSQYIVPYKTEYERLNSAQALIDTLRTRFRLREEDVQHIMEDAVVSKSYRQKPLLLTMDTLVAEGVARKSFVEYPWVITLDKGKLTEKINILRTLRGFRDINDFVPFLRIQIPRLRKVVGFLNSEADHITYGNRIYYIADKLQVSASTVTKYLANRLFVLEMPLEMFKTNLKNMVKYNVDSANILKDLWAFRYAPRSVELRLKRAMSAKKDKIMPWMVRCPETILQKSLQITMDDLEVLGNRTTAEYIAERLGFTAEEAQCIMNRHPQVNKVRVKKIKEVLDYLLDEVKFTRYEISQVPRILCHSLETTKQRMEELKEHGCRPSSLVIVCKSKREYQKFLNSWIDNYDPNKTIKKNEEIKDEFQS